MPAAVTDAYCTAATYRALNRLSDTGIDSTILDDLVAVSRELDRRTDRFFTKDSAAVARTFYPRGYYRGDPEAENPWRGIRGARMLLVDDIASTTGLSIVIDENRLGSFSGYTALAATDYQLFPLNAAKGPEPKPWTRIYIPSWSTKQGWPSGCPVEVTAIWGWPSVPKAIERAVAHIAGILRLESPRATERIGEDIAGAIDMSPGAKQIVNMIIRDYSRKRFYE